jgi:hypothetical protein
MTSLSDAYGTAGAARRLSRGVVLFVVGAAMVLAGIVLATTPVGEEQLGLGLFGARELAGVLAGLGVPAVVFGVLQALPTDRFVRRAAVVGAVVAALGVVGFVLVYPGRWWGTPESLALPVAAVYSFGAVTTFWCLFTGVAKFRTRRAPGGTVSLKVVDGDTRVVSVTGDRLAKALGGVGLLGDTPDGGVRTQTAARSDGGATTQGGAELLTDDTDTDTDSGSEPGSGSGPAPQGPPGVDPYCGNCSQFRYVRTEDGLTPYCGFHEELMDDMEACGDWEVNTADEGPGVE